MGKGLLENRERNDCSEGGIGSRLLDQTDELRDVPRDLNSARCPGKSRPVGFCEKTLSTTCESPVTG